MVTKAHINIICVCFHLSYFKSDPDKDVSIIAQIIEVVWLITILAKTKDLGVYSDSQVIFKPMLMPVFSYMTKYDY